MDRERNWEVWLIVVIAALMAFFIIFHEYTLAQEPVPRTQVYQRLVPMICGPSDLLVNFLKKHEKTLIYSGVGLGDRDNVVIAVYENPKKFFTIVLWSREACVVTHGQLGQLRMRPDFITKQDE
jgi:hypothetical protein